MATSKTTRSGAVKRSDPKSVSGSGGRANARASVPTGGKGGGTKAQKRGADKAPVPTVQPTARVATPYPSDRYPDVDPTVLLSAFGRAEKAGAPDNVKWDPTNQQWIVPSATDARRSYRVWRRHSKSGPRPFWIILECNCQAEQSGSYLVCWHKCAVKMWLNIWFSRRSFTTQMEDHYTDEEDVEEAES